MAITDVRSTALITNVMFVSESDTEALHKVPDKERKKCLLLLSPKIHLLALPSLPDIKRYLRETPTYLGISQELAPDLTGAEVASSATHQVLLPF